MQSFPGWQPQCEVLGPRVQRYAFERDGRPLSYERAVRLWRDDAGFVDVFCDLLREAPFDAFFWETPPVTRDTCARPFEFVLVDSPQLARVRPEPDVFREHFCGPAAHDGIATFANLGADARLVAPCPTATTDDYPHLAAFIRRATRVQVHALWRRVGEALTERLGDRPVWVSTAGLGVYWLHVRLDSVPKYYTHEPYTRPGYLPPR